MSVAMIVKCRDPDWCVVGVASLEMTPAEVVLVNFITSGNLEK